MAKVLTPDLNWLLYVQQSAFLRKLMLGKEFIDETHIMRYKGASEGLTWLTLDELVS